MIRLTTLILTLVLSATTDAQNLLMNGSFENPDIPTNSLDNSISVPGWNGVAFLFDGEPSPIWPESGSVGNQYADIGNNPTSVARQFFEVASGQILDELSFDANGSTAALQSFFRVEIWDTNSVAMLFGENAVVTTSDTAWTPFSFDLTPLSAGVGSYELRFFGTTGLSTNDTLIDNVSITAIPEPCSLALFTFGLSGLVLRRR